MPRRDPPPPADARALPPPLATRFDAEEALVVDGARWIGRVRSRPEGRPLILKALDTGRVEPAVAARFRREVEALARLDHPRLVRVTEHGEVDGVVFLVAPDAGAETLEAQLDSRGTLDVPTTTRLAEQLLEALTVADEEDLVHRDVKPANVLVLPDGNAQLLDFGIARPLEVDTRLTETGELLGTPAWMAPEQVMGKPPDPRDDLYALGLVLHVALTGTNPMEAEDLEEMLHRQLHAPLPPLGRAAPEAPAWLVGLVSDLTAKRRTDRPATAREALERLRRHVRPDTGSQAHPPRRSALGPAAALALGLACLGGVLLLVDAGPRAPPPPGSAPTGTEAPWSQALAAVEAAVATAHQDPVILAGLSVTGTTRPPEVRQRWGRARARLDELLRELAGPLDQLAAAPLDPELAGLVHDLWIRAELLHRSAAPAGMPDRSNLAPLLRLAGRVTSVYPGPWVDTPRKEARDLSLEYVRRLGAGGTAWRPLRRADDYRMLSGGAVRDEDGLKHVNGDGVAFVDPVIDGRVQAISRAMKETFAYPRDDVPTELSAPLEEGAGAGRDLWLAFVMREWRRTSVPELHLVGRERTVRLSFEVPGGAEHAMGTFTGTILVRVAAGAVPAGARRLRLRALALQPFASPHQLSRVAEILQLREGHVTDALLTGYARGTEDAWSF